MAWNEMYQGDDKTIVIRLRNRETRVLTNLTGATLTAYLVADESTVTSPEGTLTPVIADAPTDDENPVGTNREIRVPIPAATSAALANTGYTLTVKMVDSLGKKSTVLQHRFVINAGLV